VCERHHARSAPLHADAIVYADAIAAGGPVHVQAGATYALAPRNPAIHDLRRDKQSLTTAPVVDEDCARAALYLCSDASRAVTGIVPPVDAAWGVSG
jgi:enoyl-[acyl-carrier-protein] reductase (NADH)